MSHLENCVLVSWFIWPACALLSTNAYYIIQLRITLHGDQEPHFMPLFLPLVLSTSKKKRTTISTLVLHNFPLRNQPLKAAKSLHAPHHGVGIEPTACMVPTTKTWPSLQGGTPVLCRRLYIAAALPFRPNSRDADSLAEGENRAKDREAKISYTRIKDVFLNNDCRRI